MSKSSPGFDGTSNGLNKTCATKVVDVITESYIGFSSNDPRGTLNIIANKGAIIQPGLFEPSGNNQLGYTLLFASAQETVLANPAALRGQKCLQTKAICKANADSTKFSPSSGDDFGCYCIDSKPCNTFT